MTRVIAVDWSGAVRDAGNIWLADVVDGEPARLERMPSRQSVADELIASAHRDPQVVAGLDFAFSFPAWFAREHGATTALDLWRIAEQRGEGWLATCEPPFFGRAGSTKHRCAELYRRTERECQALHGALPKSVFQIGGPGAVGTGSIRGMPILRRLHDAGFAVWPFDAPGWPRVIEIYPRLFARGVTKSLPSRRLRHLNASCPGLPERVRTAALDSEDAFDALVSAFGMWRHRDQLAALPEARDDRERIEGAIWLPNEAPPSPRGRGPGGEV